MMIWFYSGTPGSGKSFHVAKKIMFRLKTQKKAVISTFDIDLDFLSRHGRDKLGSFTYVPINELNPKFLYEYAMKNHVKGKEGQTLVIIDECQIIFNPREFGKAGRMDWINFFTQHRHLGYDFILISQFDRLVDRQIRSLFEYEIKHRKVNNLGILFLLPVTCFVAITVWYGVKEKCSQEFFVYNKKVSKLYDSYSMFERFMEENGITADNEVEIEVSPCTAQAGAGGPRPKRLHGGLGWFKNWDKLLEGCVIKG